MRRPATAGLGAALAPAPAPNSPYAVSAWNRSFESLTAWSALVKLRTMTSSDGDRMARIRQIQELLPDGALPPEPARRRRGPHIGRAGTAVAAVAAAIAAAIILMATGVVPGAPWRDSAAATPTVGFSPDPEVGGSGATQTGQAFLAAWQRGDLQAAADISDDPAAALAALRQYRHDLDLRGLTLLPNPTGASGWLTFSVSAQVGTPSSPWSYTSGLAAYQGHADGVPRWFVKWSPSILFTGLKPGRHLALGSIPATASAVDDASGRAITAADAPSLAGLVHRLEQGSADPGAAGETGGSGNAGETGGSGTAGGGRPGTTVQIVSSTGAVLATAATVAEPVAAGPIRTTIDLRAQAAAQAAANQAPNSSVAIVQPSTGNILAIANNPPAGVDTAMIGALAPGSTFKAVSTTLAARRRPRHRPRPAGAVPEGPRGGRDRAAQLRGRGGHGQLVPAGLRAVLQQRVQRLLPEGDDG